MKILIFLLLLSCVVSAEQEYFTWVDAQGRIHNSPLERKTQSANSVEQSSQNDAAVNRPDIDNPKSYLSEQQFQQKKQQYEAENPPFYTYVDETGRVRNQVIVDQEIDVLPVAPQSYDHILAPPFRVGLAMSDDCCQRYRNYFFAPLPAHKAVVFSGFLNSVPLSTRAGPRQAWYVSLESGADLVDVALRLRGLPVGSGQEPEVAVIVTDEKFRALYFIPQLSLLEKEESWAEAGFYHSLLRIEDPSVAAFIVYFPANPAEGVSLEVEWWHGKTSD